MLSEQDRENAKTIRYENSYFYKKELVSNSRLCDCCKTISNERIFDYIKAYDFMDDEQVLSSQERFYELTKKENEQWIKNQLDFLDKLDNVDKSSLEKEMITQNLLGHYQKQQNYLKNRKPREGDPMAGGKIIGNLTAKDLELPERAKRLLHDLFVMGEIAEKYPDTTPYKQAF